MAEHHPAEYFLVVAHRLLFEQFGMAAATLWDTVWLRV